MKTTLPKIITIIGRRWFQKSYGNTYHTVVVMADDKEQKSEKTYGYDDQYQQTAIDILHGMGYEDAKYPLSLWCRDNGIEFNCHVSDVTRERDL